MSRPRSKPPTRPTPGSPQVALTAEESLALHIVRTLGREALDRLLLTGPYQWVYDLRSGRFPR